MRGSEAKTRRRAERKTARASSWRIGGKKAAYIHRGVGKKNRETSARRNLCGRLYPMNRRDTQANRQLHCTHAAARKSVCIHESRSIGAYLNLRVNLLIHLCARTHLRAGAPPQCLLQLPHVFSARKRELVLFN